jgi:hypothetical protein
VMGQGSGAREEHPAAGWADAIGRTREDAMSQFIACCVAKIAEEEQPDAGCASAGYRRMGEEVCASADEIRAAGVVSPVVMERADILMNDLQVSGARV